jgi:SAP domain
MPGVRFATVQVRVFDPDAALDRAANLSEVVHRTPRELAHEAAGRGGGGIDEPGDELAADLAGLSLATGDAACVTSLTQFEEGDAQPVRVVRDTQDLTVAELRAELRSVGLSANGAKGILLERFEAHLVANSLGIEENDGEGPAIKGAEEQENAAADNLPAWNAPEMSKNVTSALEHGTDAGPPAHTTTKTYSRRAQQATSRRKIRAERKTLAERR